MNYLKPLEAEVSALPNVSIHPHRFGGREFRFGNAEVGHTHAGGIVDIPFPRPVRDALLAEGWLRSTAGFRTQDGLHFRSAVKKALAMHFGSCDCHTSAMR
jgi:Family of unknown function (DUF5519)